MIVVSEFMQFLQGAGGIGQASSVGNLTGMTRAECYVGLTARGATKHVTAGSYTHYRFPDGSQVYLRPTEH